MTRFFLLPLSLLLSLAPLASAAEAVLASGTAGAARWEVTCPFDNLPSVGFVPVTVTATNGSPRKTTAEYEISSTQGYYGGATSLLASGSLDLQPGKPATATHWIWRSTSYGSDHNNSFVSFSINTPTGNSSDTLGHGSGMITQVAVSDTVVKAEGQFFRQQRGQLTSRSFGIALTVFEPDSLPADWRIFSSISGIFLTPEDWDELSPGVRDAMRTWIGFGGSLRIMSVDEADRERVAKEVAPSGAELGVFANATPVRTLHFSRFEEEFANLISNNHLAFAVGVPPSDVTARRPYSRYSYSEYRERRKNKFPPRDKFGPRGIPYFIICMLLIIFAIVVGPVSLFLWAGPGKRHRLFFTVPVFSLSTSGLLLLVMIFQDGLGIDGRRFVLLDLATANSSQTDAIIYQEQFTRAGMIGGGGFEVEEGLLPLVEEEAMEEGLALRDGRAIGSWFSSRRDRSLTLAGAVPVRWQVTHEGASEDSLRLRVESPITKFETAWFVDDSQQVWAWDRNPPDSDGVYTFIPASHNPASVMSPMFKECSDDLRKHVLDRMKQRNQRNRFWALSKDAGEAARTTHPKVDWLGSTLVLTSKVVPKT